VFVNVWAIGRDPGFRSDPSPTLLPHARHNAFTSGKKILPAPPTRPASPRSTSKTPSTGARMILAARLQAAAAANPNPTRHLDSRLLAEAISSRNASDSSLRYSRLFARSRTRLHSIDTTISRGVALKLRPCRSKCTSGNAMP
jgi:hypothetical protein